MVYELDHLSFIPFISTSSGRLPCVEAFAFVGGSYVDFATCVSLVYRKVFSAILQKVSDTWGQWTR